MDGTLREVERRYGLMVPVGRAFAGRRASASGTADLGDAALMAAVEGLTLANDRFRHYDHVRPAWVFLREAGLEAATDRMALALRRFAVHRGGAASRYHATITRALG